MDVHTIWRRSSAPKANGFCYQINLLDFNLVLFKLLLSILCIVLYLFHVSLSSSLNSKVMIMNVPFYRIIKSLQCRRRPFGPLRLHWQQSHPGLIPVTPCIYPTNPPDAKGKFSRANHPNLYIFGLWEETGAPGGTPHRHGVTVQTPQTVTRDRNWTRVSGIVRQQSP